MEDQRIELETGKLAQEKGFNIRCKYKYIETLEHIIEMGRGGDCTFPYQAPRILRSNGLSMHEKEICPAPTQTTLQRWLLEEEGIDAVSFSVRYTGYEEIGYWTYAVKSIQPTKGYKFDTYEQALEAGLIIALNLIK